MDEFTESSAVDAGYGIVFSLDDFQEQGCLVFGFEWVLKSANFVKDAAKRPDVGLIVVRTVLANFGTEVIRGANFGSYKIFKVF